MFGCRIVFMSISNDIDWTAKVNEEKFPILKRPNCMRKESRKDIGRSLALETKPSCMGTAITHLKEVRIHGHTDGATIQRKRSSRFCKSQCAESWNSAKVTRKGDHTLQCGFFEYRTSISNHSLCESAQYVRSSFALE